MLTMSFLFLEQLWTAPELLRSPDSFPRGTQKADVYSYGIMLQEILLRTVPYGDVNLDPPGKYVRSGLQQRLIIPSKRLNQSILQNNLERFLLNHIP